MNNSFKLAFIALLLAAAGSAAARSLHKSKPLGFEELPPVCQQYFKRAEACYDKAGKAALFHQGNTDFLRQSLPAATDRQRVTMCQMALDGFSDKARQLKCE